MSGIEKSIVKLLGDEFETVEGETRQDYLKRLSSETNKYFDEVEDGDAEFDKLPERSQDWLNTATKARKASKPVKEFADADEEEVAERFAPKKSTKEIKPNKVAKKPVKTKEPEPEAGEDEIEDSEDEADEDVADDEIGDAPEEITDDEAGEPEEDAEEPEEEKPAKKKPGRPVKADKPAKAAKKTTPKADKPAKPKRDPNAPKKRRGRQSTAMDDYVEIRLKSPKLTVDQALEKLKEKKGIDLKRSTVLTAENHMQRFVRVAGKIKWVADAE